MMVEVSIRVNEGGYSFEIAREDEFNSSRTMVTQRIDALLASARSAMYAALTAAPQPLPPIEEVST